MKCWNSNFSAKGRRVIIVVVHVKALGQGELTPTFGKNHKNHWNGVVGFLSWSQCGGQFTMASAVGELQKKNERQDETQFITKIVGKTSLCLSYFVL
jgi:hypothetical protein